MVYWNNGAPEECTPAEDHPERAIGALVIAVGVSVLCFWTPVGFALLKLIGVLK